MSSLQIIGIALLVVIAAVALWIYLSFPVYKERYRLTVDVEAGGQIHSGLSVIQVRWLLYPKWIQGIFAGAGGESRVYGQAVFIDWAAAGRCLRPFDLRRAFEAIPPLKLSLSRYGPFTRSRWRRERI